MASQASLRATANERSLPPVSSIEGIGLWSPLPQREEIPHPVDLLRFLVPPPARDPPKTQRQARFVPFRLAEIVEGDFEDLFGGHRADRSEFPGRVRLDPSVSRRGAAAVGGHSVPGSALSRRSGWRRIRRFSWRRRGNRCRKRRFPCTGPSPSRCHPFVRGTRRGRR